MRNLFHDIYYKFSGKKGIEFAMKCKDVTAHIDLGDLPRGPLGPLRFYLHLGLCQACKNYFEASRLLKQAIGYVFAKGNPRDQIETLNQDLLRRYSRR